jgi:hypothetical protein
LFVFVLLFYFIIFPASFPSVLHSLHRSFHLLVCSFLNFLFTFVPDPIPSLWSAAEGPLYNELHIPHGTDRPAQVHPPSATVPERKDDQ